ncbi:fructose-1,6-bisphosphatase class 3 [Ligilactobacillus pabuli]|uniref:Fructose-1,6-bisphosphatase class 3 n=1 Tax=Ligilactobacillus pabuli TaxID=2886039 RepID=A0ABQ5JM18_9LACO|nr:fructose-1,6-bisphosphatase [Ligilactobacillus pabuli]GKS82172.1 fructose-1,6-bisphosphatase class 3 [Ligilactobacillus pabuli]HIW89044.1 fructose-1,6-bisphosphatase [Candidatus Ligilactobacillus excrementipullorum]
MAKGVKKLNQFRDEEPTNEQKYLRDLMEERFPTKEAVITEIMNLEAILHLPKATEHFVSDLHGEYAAFDHILRNGSGNIKNKITAIFGGRLTPKRLQNFASLIYYPEDKLEYKKHQLEQDEDGALEQWYLDTIQRLLELLQFVSTKYTRSKVRKALEPNFAYITEELLYTDPQVFDKRSYLDQLMKNLVSMGVTDEFIIATCYTIQQLVVDHLHVLGDIYDRGEHPELIMDRLMSYHSVDIQWGNHDMLWIGASAGSALCMLNLLRISARYNNLATIEDAYGISLRHLTRFAEENYGDNPAFRPKLVEGDSFNFDGEGLQLTQIQQAVAIMQFKLEIRTIAREPDFNMADRALLTKVDYDKKTIQLAGKTYQLTNTCFDLIDPKDPGKLTAEEEELISGLLRSFIDSKSLQRHLKFLVNKGSMYLCYNNNLLLHGCMPVTAKGEFLPFKYHGKEYRGKQLVDLFDQQVRHAYNDPCGDDHSAADLIWYLWQGPISPLFGKEAMTTFERYFIKDKATHEEVRNPYFKLRHDEGFVDILLKEFGLDPSDGHVVNGHTPVKRGHDAIMANGKMLVIDGGYSKAYQPTTGFGGYTLLYNSYGLQLVEHHPFTSKEDSIVNGTDIVSARRVVNHEVHRKSVADTDIGARLKENVKMLRSLLAEY